MEKPLSKKEFSTNSEFSDFQTEQDLLFSGKIGQTLINMGVLGVFSMEEDVKELIDNLCKEFPMNRFCEKEVDKFTNEVRINTFRSRTLAFPHNHPIDLLYISKPEGDRFYVLYTGSDWLYSTGTIIFNIDDRTNIELKIDSNDEFLKGKTNDELQFWDEKTQRYRKEYRSYLSISKEDYLKCCHANHLSVRVCIDDSSPKAYEDDCDELIPCFQILYNETCDDQMFEKTKEEWTTTFMESTKKGFKKLYKLPEHRKNNENDVSGKGCSLMLILLLLIITGSTLTFISL